MPFQFRTVLGRHLRLSAFAAASEGTRLRDPDGNESIDVGGSYGVNVFGYEFYKTCIAEGVRRAEALGPVLGPYHEAVAFNVPRLCEISGLDAVSFHAPRALLRGLPRLVGRRAAGHRQSGAGTVYLHIE